MSGRVSKALRRMARRQSGNRAGIAMKVNPRTNEAREVNLHREFKRMYEKLPRAQRHDATTWDMYVGQKPIVPKPK